MTSPNVLGPKAGYIEILNHYREEKGGQKYNPLRPSAAGKDARELAYEWMEYRGYATYETEPLEAETQRIFKLGHAIERHLLYEFEDALKRAGGDLEIRYKQQVLSFFKLHDGTQIEGSCDLTVIPKHKKFGGGVGDVKSKKDKFSSFFKTNWDETSDKLSNMKTVHVFGEECYWVEDLPEFLEELDDYFFAMNFKQLNMYFFDEDQFLRQRGVDHAFIKQYGKNDSRLREIRFKPSEKIYNQVKDKFLLVAKVVDETKDPTQVPRENVLGSAACAFSKYRKVDWPEVDALKEHFKTWPAKQWPKDLDRLGGAAEDLRELFSKFEEVQAQVSTLEKIEQKIVSILDRCKVSKVQLDNMHVYQTKQLKSGGVGGKGQMVLRRGKL